VLCNYRWAIISGFLKEKLGRVRELLPSCAGVKEPVLEEKGWITLLVEIKSH
jgi:ribosomal protein L11 methylase PrmA